MTKKTEEKAATVEAAEDAKPIAKPSKKTFDLSKYNVEVVESGAEYWDFEKEPEFIGYFVRAFAPKTGEQAGEEIGFIFKSVYDGNEHIISNSYTIDQALLNPTEESEGKPLAQCKIPLRIEFKGQTTKADGQAFNKFKIDALWPIE